MYGLSRYRVAAVTLTVLAVLAMSSLTSYSYAQEGDGSKTTKVGVPGIFVRQAVTEAGVVVMGYRAANQSVGGKILGLEVRLTVNQGFNTKLSREDVALKLPDGTMVPLMTREEFVNNRSAINAVNARANVQSDTLDYLPARAEMNCIIGFFPDPMERTSILTRDKIDLDPTRGCAGAFYFMIEDGITLGQHFLLVRLVDEDVVVPFTIMTKEEQKEAEKKLKEMRKAEKAKRKAEKQAEG